MMETTKRGLVVGLLSLGGILLFASLFVTWGDVEVDAPPDVRERFEYRVKASGVEWSFNFPPWFSSSGSCRYSDEASAGSIESEMCGVADGAEFRYSLLKTGAPILVGSFAGAFLVALIPLLAEHTQVAAARRFTPYVLPLSLLVAGIGLFGTLMIVLNAEAALGLLASGEDRNEFTFGWTGGLAVPFLGIASLVAGGFATRIEASDDPVDDLVRLGIDVPPSRTPAAPLQAAGNPYGGSGSEYSATYSSPGHAASRDAYAATSPTTSGTAATYSSAAAQGHAQASTPLPRPKVRASPDAYASAPEIPAPSAEEDDPYATPKPRPGEPVKALQCPGCRTRFDAPARRPLFVKCPDCGRSALLHQ